MLAFSGVPNLLIVAMATAFVAAVGWSRVWGRNVAGRISWLDAWLKAWVITVTAIMLVVYLPARVLQTTTVANLSRPVQDLIATVVWGVALLAVIIGLEYLRRARRA